MNGVPPPEEATAAAAAAALMALAVLETVNHCFLLSSSSPAEDEGSTEGQACWHEADEWPERDVGSVVVNGQEPRGQWNRPSVWRRHLIWTVCERWKERDERGKQEKGSDVVSVHRDAHDGSKRERERTDPCCRAR